MAVPRELRPCSLLVGAGVALTGLYFVLPAGGTAAAGVFIAVGMGSALAMLYGIRLHRPGAPAPWLLFALGTMLFATGDLVSEVAPRPATPSAHDYVYLAGYPALALGLVLLVFAVGTYHRHAAIADAGIVTLAFAVFQWVYVMAPAIEHGGSVLDRRIVFGLYPAMDVVLLAGLTGFFVSPAWRTPAFRLLAVGVGLLLVGDEAFGLMSSYRQGGLVDATWLLSYVFWAAAALHPSMRDLTQPRRQSALKVSAWRIGLLLAALLVVPAALLTQKLRGKHTDLYEIVGLSMGISLLVVARLTGILRALERIRLRERAARGEAEFARALLSEQNAKLLEADRMKDEFVALISHDLRTPLTSIIGYVELALEESGGERLDDERRNYLAIVARSSDRLLRLVDDLLFVARLQTGRLALEAEMVDLGDVAQLAVEEARDRADRKGLAISFLAETPVRVHADRGRLFQLLDNLIGNAIKFTPAGGRVDVRVVEAPGGGVLEVSDTGIGLGADTERIFERFFRAPNAIDQQIPGTGLGLFIARAIADAHGGAISASGRDGGGTTFRIQLPAAPAAPEPEPEPAERGELVA